MLITLSGVSGSGKTTLLKLLVAEHKFKLLPSYTTRERRPSEALTSTYEHIEPSVFLQMNANDEWALISQYAGNSYGTRRSDLVQAVASAEPVGADLSLNSLERIEIEHGFIAQSYFLHIDRAVALQRMQRRGDESALIDRRASLYEQETLHALAFLAKGNSLQIIDATASPAVNVNLIVRGISSRD